MRPPPGDWDYTLKVVNELLRRSTYKPKPHSNIPKTSPIPPLPNTWSSISKDGLDTWIATQMNRSPLPIFQVSTEAGPLPKRLPLASTEVEIERRADSGIIEMRLSALREANVSPDTYQFLQYVLRLAARTDPMRSFEPGRVSQSEAIYVEMRSRVTQFGMPVLGPGGKVTIYREPESLQADIVIRSLLERTPSQWRESSEISRRVRNKTAEHEHALIQGSLGYFELSKYDQQTWLRPAFVFILDIEFSANRNITWRETIVESATTTTKISDAEGLGAWTG